MKIFDKIGEKICFAFGVFWLIVVVLFIIGKCFAIEWPTEFSMGMTIAGLLTVWILLAVGFIGGILDVISASSKKPQKNLTIQESYSVKKRWGKMNKFFLIFCLSCSLAIGIIGLVIHATGKDLYTLLILLINGAFFSGYGAVMWDESIDTRRGGYSGSGSSGTISFDDDEAEKNSQEGPLDKATTIVRDSSGKRMVKGDWGEKIGKIKTEPSLNPFSPDRQVIKNDWGEEIGEIEHHIFENDTVVDKSGKEVGKITESFDILGDLANAFSGGILGNNKDKQIKK